MDVDMHEPTAWISNVSAQSASSTVPVHAESVLQGLSDVQRLLAHADRRWKDAHQTQKRHTARKLVQEVKMARVSATLQLHVALADQKLVGCRILPRRSNSCRT